MFESDNKVKIYLCRLLLENTRQHFFPFLSLVCLAWHLANITFQKDVLQNMHTALHTEVHTAHHFQARLPQNAPLAPSVKILKKRSGLVNKILAQSRQKPQNFNTFRHKMHTFTNWLAPGALVGWLPLPLVGFQWSCLAPSGHLVSHPCRPPCHQTLWSPYQPMVCVSQMG